MSDSPWGKKACGSCWIAGLPQADGFTIRRPVAIERLCDWCGRHTYFDMVTRPNSDTGRPAEVSQ